MRAIVFALMLSPSPAAAQIVTPPTANLANVATKADVASVQASVPQPATSMPPAVSDASAIGTQTTFYALANHTHASKARKARLQSAADGSLFYVFESAFAAGVVPRCTAIAETTFGVTDVYNVQLNGTPTNTQAQFLVGRFQRSVASLLGLSVLSIPSAPGATWVHITCLEP